jgi:quercetin dioxygenase-like cupin family protein
MATGLDSGRMQIDSEAFAAAFAERPLAVHHTLLDHPLLTLDALGELAERLPANRVEHNVGSLPEVVGDVEVERSTMPPAEIARTIETNGLWMVLKDIELVPEYRRLLDELLDEVEPIVGAREGGMIQREGFVFLSAPGSVTPSHTDPEHNFLLQVRGTKQMTVGRFPDERTRQLELEDHVSGGHRNIEWMPVEPQVFDMQPGDAVYVPPHAPHWVQNGDQASISLSITFRTPATERVARVSSINARLRRLHLNPRPPGSNEQVDRAKAAVSKALGRLRRRG